jgi:hypothetical protein
MADNSTTDDQARCPFCDAGINEDMALYGGTCPRCFGEIPGEEAITDPGEMPTEIGLKIYEARSRAWHIVPILMALGVAVCLGAWAVWVGVVRPTQMADRIDFDEESDFDFMAELVVFDLTKPEPPKEADKSGGSAKLPSKSSGQQVAAKKTTGTGTGKSASGSAMQSALLSGSGAGDIGTTGNMAKLNFNSNAGGGEAGGSRRSASGGAVLPAGGGPDLEIKKTSGSGGALGLSVQVKAEREKPIIKDPAEIKEHIYTVFRKSLPSLVGCYKDRLKDDSAVRGKWRISFVVGRDGRTREASAQGISMVDEVLEACLTEKVSTWSFYRLPNDQPVSKSLNFTPS